MPRYHFQLESMDITQTRSRHNDTDWASVSLQIGHRAFGTVVKPTGDVNNGHHPLDQALVFDADIPDAQAPIAFQYTIVNAGHAGRDETIQRLEEAGNELAGVANGPGASPIAVDLDASTLPAGGAGGWSVLSGTGIAALNLLFGWLLADCDGRVVQDLILTNRLELDNLTARNGQFRSTRPYPGTDSPSGCNHDNSAYTATFSISRQDRSIDLFAQGGPVTALLVNKRSGLCLDIPSSSPDDGAPIQQFPLNYGDNQRWQISQVGGDPPGPQAKYAISSVSSGKCLDIPSGDPGDGVRLQQFQCNQGLNQQWLFVQAGDDPDYYFIFNAATGKVLDVPDASLDAGVFIQQFQSKDSDNENQRWKLLP